MLVESFHGDAAKLFKALIVVTKSSFHNSFYKKYLSFSFGKVLKGL